MFLRACFSCSLTNPNWYSNKLGSYPIPSYPGQVLVCDLTESLPKSRGIQSLIDNCVSFIGYIVGVPFKIKNIRRDNLHLQICNFSLLLVTFYCKKMFDQDEGKIECAVGNREICVWQGKKAEIVLICGIYLSLALGNLHLQICNFSLLLVTFYYKKMFYQDEGKIECAVGNREICVWQGKKAEIVLICGIYLSLALVTAKFKQLD